MAKIIYIFFGQVENFDVDYFLVTSKANFYSNAQCAESGSGVSGIDCASMRKRFDFKEIYYNQNVRIKNLATLQEHSRTKK